MLNDEDCLACKLEDFAILEESEKMTLFFVQMDADGGKSKYGNVGAQLVLDAAMPSALTI